MAGRPSTRSTNHLPRSESLSASPSTWKSSGSRPSSSPAQETTSSYAVRLDPRFKANFVRYTSSTQTLRYATYATPPTDLRRALWVGPFPSYPRSMVRGMSDGAERSRTTPPRDGWCRYAMMPAPRWHHHHMCGVPEYFGWDLGELCDAVRERGQDEWADPVDHRTAVLVAHHRAKDAGNERLADEMSRIDASLFEYVRDERGVGVRYLDSEHIEWIRRDPPPASEHLCQVIYVTDWTEVPVGSIRFESRGSDPHAVLRIPSHYARVERDLRTYITRRFNERREDWGVVDAPCLTEEAEAIAKRID